MADPQPITSIAAYKDIPGFPGYRVGDDGSVWSCKVRGSYTGRTGPWWQMKWLRDTSGRFKVNLRRNGRSHWRQVHRLVLEAFVGPCPAGLEACHQDDNPANNRIENLRWDTHISNCEDRSRNGINVGEKHPNAKLTERDVMTIKDLRSGGMTFRGIADRFSVSRSLIQGVINGRRWRHVS